MGAAACVARAGVLPDRAAAFDVLRVRALSAIAPAGHHSAMLASPPPAPASPTGPSADRVMRVAAGQRAFGVSHT